MNYVKYFQTLKRKEGPKAFLERMGSIWYIKKGQNCGNSQEGYKSQVEVAEEGVAHEGVVDRRVEGGRYKGSNSSIIKPEHDV